jgi:DNA-binding CsgD family transcriptional regulator
MIMQKLPNLAESRLADAIRAVGDVKFEQALQSFLHAVCAPDNLLILGFRSAGPPLVLYRQSDNRQVFSQLDLTYLAGAYRLDPFYDLHLRHAPAGSYRIADIAPDAFQRSRYFIEYYEQTTLVDEITFVAYPSPGVTLNIAIGRDASSGQPFSARDVETCARIAPLVQAIAEPHWAHLARVSGPAEDTSALLAQAARDRRGILLSPRQAEVALMILRGHSTMSIALRMALSPQTVKVFRKQLYARCSISSQAELFALMLPLLKSGEQQPV